MLKSSLKLVNGLQVVTNNTVFLRRDIGAYCRMTLPRSITGTIKINANELNLDLTLLGGQSFRWQKIEGEKPEWRGVAYDTYWVLHQNESTIDFTAFPANTRANDKSIDARHLEAWLKKYFRLEFNLPKHVEHWKQAHEHFGKLANNLKAVRVLDQEPLENILSFICSQNNNIKRISTMINWLCSTYGDKIGTFNGHDVRAFPTLDALSKGQTELESNLRAAKFGYRAKFIAQSIEKIAANGGTQWFSKLRKATFDEARLQLVTLPGIGFKVADCICLMSLNHLAAVPIDTHIFKVAQRAYMPELAKTKSVTPKIYDEIANHFRDVYGPYAGWAQTVLFCSELQQFQSEAEKLKAVPSKKKRK